MAIMRKWRGDKRSKAWFGFLVVLLMGDLISVVNAIIAEDKVSLIFNISLTLLMLAAVWLDWMSHHDD